MVIDSQILSFIQYSPAIGEVDVHVIPIGNDWMAPIIFYLKNSEGRRCRRHVLC